MARTRVKLNSRGMRALLNERGVGDMLEARMERALSAARESAPVDTGAYRAGLVLQRATTDRVVVRLISTDSKGPLIESRLGVLSRALDAAGGE